SRSRPEPRGGPHRGRSAWHDGHLRPLPRRNSGVAHPERRPAAAHRPGPPELALAVTPGDSATPPAAVRCGEPAGGRPPMRISSWNINGLRASLKTGDFMKWLSETPPDICGIQEVKATPDQLGFDMPWRELGYKDWWKPAEKSGYSGALLLSKIDPI